MSVIRDVVDLMKDISDYDEVEILKNKPKGSLTRMTKDAVLQFPVIASNSLDIQIIQLCSKALERKFATLLRIAFSLNSITDERDLIDYIRQFHQNTGLSDREFTSNLVVNKLVNECTIEYKITSEVMTEGQKAVIMNRLTKDNHRLLREYLSELNTGKLNDKVHYLSEAGNGKPNFLPSTNRIHPIAGAMQYMNAKIDKGFNTLKDMIKSKPVEPPKPTYTKYGMGGKQGAVFTTADVTKANEVMPLPLELKVYIVDKDGNSIERDFMIGVKAVIHPVSSEYMIDSMIDGYRRGKFFFNFIKATTGEIKFFKDFLFMVDQIKTDAIKNASGTNNKWFTFLKRRALLAKAKNTLRFKNQLLPNTSIVLSGEEADALKQQGVDILDPAVATDLLSHYFLLSIVVVDPALEIVHMISDGEENYSSMSITALSRESKEDNSTKQILSLLKSRPQF